MLNETRVNLRHLLEDIRDSYNLPVEEVIVTELVANALDSRASKICFFTDTVNKTVTCVDNGCGMRRPALRDYHNIAATTKERGAGIGFAGLGAKLSLLLAEEVVTETRGGHGSRAATAWRLASPTRAPWKFIPSPGLVLISRGTAVRIRARDAASPLCDPEFLTATVHKHFFPLLSPEVHGQLLRFFYKHGVIFSINGQPVGHEEPSISLNAAPGEARRTFFVYLGSKSRRPVGFGYLARSMSELSEGQSGITVSTFGKVIKRGWEWLGILPPSHAKLSGLVEIPGLAEILTTNKTDFLSDQTALKKYYRYRKAVQSAVLPILQEWGESEDRAVATERELKPLQQDIKSALQKLLGDFPELEPLVGSVYKRTGAGGAAVSPEAGRAEYLRGAGSEEKQAEGQTTGDELGDRQPSSAGHHKEGDDESGQGRRKESGLKIAFEAALESTALGRVAEDTVFINTSHPAWAKAKNERLETYHVLATVAWALSSFLEPERSPHEFVARFLAAWGSGGQQALRLFRPGGPGGYTSEG